MAINSDVGTFILRLAEQLGSYSCSSEWINQLKEG